MRSLLVGILFAGTLTLFPVASGAPPQVSFQSARPVWPQNREREMNLLMGFRAPFKVSAGQHAVLRVTAATIYRAWLNGQFLGWGPARGPHGFFRIDEWDLSSRLLPGTNLIAVEVAGYNCNSYYLLNQPSFLQAEVAAGDKVLASTAGQGTPFLAGLLDQRVQKVQRYSFQRPFIEVYRLTPEADHWRRDPTASLTPVTLDVLPAKALLPRRIPVPDFTVRRPVTLVGTGRVEKLAEVKNLWKDRALVAIGPQLKGYPESQLAVVPSTQMQSYRSIPTATLGRPYDSKAPLHLPRMTFQTLDLGVNRTGFLGARVTCHQNSRFWLIFDEILTDGDVDFKRLSCVNLVCYDLAPGSYRLESLEPYTLRYLKLLCLEGICEVEDVFLREYIAPEPREAVRRERRASQSSVLGRPANVPAELRGPVHGLPIPGTRRLAVR